MSDDVDIVVTLHALATYAERANHWTDDKRMMDAAGVADAIHEAMERIEELEAKLEVAMDFILRLNRFAIQADDKFLIEKSQEVLAELTGGKDE